MAIHRLSIPTKITASPTHDADAAVPSVLADRSLYLHCKYQVIFWRSMDRVFEHGGTTFEWDEAKATENRRKHGVSFEEAVTVFDDPLFVLQDASRNEESRDAAIGFSSTGRLLTIVHIEFDGQSIRIISAWRASPAEEEFYDQ